MTVDYFAFSIVSFLLGMFVVYITAYTKAKGKNKALQEDNIRLENDKQKVVAQHRNETEVLKKQHSLDIEKRKYQYEEKRHQFSKYFKLLDEFNNRSNQTFAEEFYPIMNEFFSAIIESEDDVYQTELIKFNEKIQVLTHKLHEESLKVSTETNSIRLISSPEIDKLLDAMELAIKQVTDQSTEMMNFMMCEDFIKDQSLITPLVKRSEESDAVVKGYRNDLIAQMKKELDEI